MNHARLARRLVALVLAALFLAASVAFCAQRTHAQTPANYPCTAGDWSCVNGKIIALEARVATADREARHAAQANRELTAEVQALRAQQVRVTNRQIMDALWGEQSARDWWYSQARAEGVKK